MKSTRNLLIMSLLFALPLMMTAQEKDKNIQTVKFTTSIDCASCVNTIMNNLPREKGVKDVKCDLGTKEVAVTYNKEKTNPEQLQKNIEKLGYTAKVKDKEGDTAVKKVK